MDEQKYVLEDVFHERMKNVDDENNRQNHRIDDLEAEVKQISELVASVKVLAVNIETMSKELSKQGERLEKIEEKPSKRWDSLITGIITGIVGLLIGLVSSGLIH
jgi:predicted  nucleic acid-binding Zn-ribbon protein